jgi:hypothetical protein
MHVGLGCTVTIVSLAALAVGARAEPGGKVGVVCIAPLPKQAREADRLAFAGGPQRHFTYEFTVQIGQQKPVALASSRPVPLTGIALEGTHRVVIRDADRIVESFRFRFAARGGTPLCLSYAPGYQTWSLERPRAGATWCQCEEPK